MSIISFLKKSNHGKHLVYAIPIAFVFTILCVLGVASGMEYKDKLWGGKWDWVDWSLTMLGGIIGQAISVLVYMLIK